MPFIIGQQFPVVVPSSPKTPLEIIVPLTSVIFQLTSLIQEPVTQLAKAIELPVVAENDAEPVNPFAIVAPETTVTPFTVTSTALPFQPSP